MSIEWEEFTDPDELYPHKMRTIPAMIEVTRDPIDPEADESTIVLKWYATCDLVGILNCQLEGESTSVEDTKKEALDFIISICKKRISFYTDIQQKLQS